MLSKIKCYGVSKNMKKAVILVLSVLMCFSMFSCTKAHQSDNNEAQGSASASMPQISTTKAPSDDTSKAKKLKVAMAKALDADSNNISVANDGSFEYKPKEFDEIKMYSMEYTEEIEKSAYESIDKYVDTIREYYPDGDKIKLFTKNNQDINFGENGIDSVNYTAVYINTQNQTITVYADSTGAIYSAKCNFTW